MARGKVPSSLVRPVLRAAGGRAGAVDADAGQLALGLGHLLLGLAEQRHGRTPRHEPAEVGGELAVEAEVERALGVAGGERGAGAQVDEPLALLEALAQGLLVGRRGVLRSRRGRAGGVGRAHLRVVGGPVVEAGEQVGDPLLLVLRERRVRALLLADGGRRRLALRRGAEAAEAVRGQHLGVVGQLGGEPARRGVLVVHQRVRVVGAEQVGAAGGAEQQRAAGEHAEVLAVRLEGVGQVGERVAGRGDDGHAHRRADLDDVAVADRRPVEGDVVGGVHVVRGAGGLGEGQAAGDVVVVQVGLEDVGDADAGLAGEVEHAVDVALRVDDEGDLAVVGEVAAVAEGGGLDGDDGDHGEPFGGCGGDQAALARGPVTIGWPADGPPVRASGHGRRLDAGALQEVGHRQAAVAAGADDVHRAVLRQVRHLAGQLAHGDELCSGDVSTDVLHGLAHVDDVRAVAVSRDERLQGDLSHVCCLRPSVGR